MKRFALIFLLVCVATRGAVCASNAVDDLFTEAQTAVSAGKFDDAVGIYEKIFTEHPEAIDRWYTTEKSIAITLAKKGDLSGAAQAAHLCLDGASGIQQFDDAVALVAGILSATDGKVDRANLFIAFAQTGHLDGTPNPMDAIGYPSLPARETAFATIRQQAGDNAAAARLRAVTFLFSGKPRAALAQFADAFRKSSTGTDLQRSVPDLILIGLRATRGYWAGLDAAARFVSFGPDGPDGKPNTGDDIADPFIGLLPAPLAPDQGGLAGLSVDDIAALRKVRDAALLYAGDPILKPDIRRKAFATLQRATDVLDAWSADKKGWYFDILHQVNTENLNDLLCQGAETSARGRQLHFGGVRLIWATIDADCAADRIKSTPGMNVARKQFDTVCAALDKINSQNPVSKPLKIPASFK